MIGVAIFGLGNALEPHAKALAELTGRARVVWGVARSRRRAELAAAQWGYPVTTDARVAIADPAVQAVLLLTPANAHLPFAEAAFAVGKHVLCEKPLEATVARAERLIAAGRAADRRLGVMLQMRMRPASVRLKALLDGGALGPVQAASMSVPWWRPQDYYDEPGRGERERDGGGVLMTQAIHTLDLFRWLVGIERVEAAQIRTTELHRMETEDYAAALVRLGNGAPGSVLATVAAYPGSSETIQVIARQATARMEGDTLDVAWLNGRRERVDGHESRDVVPTSRDRDASRDMHLNAPRNAMTADGTVVGGAGVSGTGNAGAGSSGTGIYGTGIYGTGITGIGSNGGGGSGSGSRIMGFSHEPHKAVISDFLDAIEQHRDPAIPGEEALATQRVIDAIIAKGA